MIRATVYLLASGAIWFAEGYIFSVFLQFKAWQTVLLAAVYLVLWLIATAWLVRLGRRPDDAHTMVVWRYLSLAPMLTVTLGSFISIPLVLSIAALGKVV